MTIRQEVLEWHIDMEIGCKWSFFRRALRIAKVYRGGSVCKGCPDFGQCTKSDRDRGISRLLKADLQEKFEAQYAQSKSQKIYALRKQKVELPFDHIKRNLKVDSFLLRGIDGVKA